MKSKMILVISLALALVLSFAACGNSSTGGDAQNPSETSGGTATQDPGGEKNDEEVYNLTASFHSPESNSSVIYTKAWCEEISEASGGRIQWTYYTSASLTSAMETFSHAKDGVCSVSWTTPVLVGAQMKANSLMTIPYVGWPINEDGGEIAWNVFEASEILQNEWAGVKVISYYPMGATVIATSDKAVSSASDLNGLNMRATNLVNSKFMEALGSNPIIISTSDAYENLSKGVVAGSLIDWNLYSSFHLYDVMKYAVEDTLYSNIGNIVMNVDIYNSLPADLQQIIDEHSGLYASKMGAKMASDMDAEFMQDCIDHDVTVAPASEDFKKELEVAGNAAVEVYYSDCEAAGIEVQSLVDMFVAELEAYGYASPIFSN